MFTTVEIVGYHVTRASTALGRVSRVISGPVLVVLICLPAGWLFWLAWARSEADAVPTIALALLLGFAEVCILALSRTLAIRTLAILVTLGAGVIALAAVALTAGLRTLLDFPRDRGVLDLSDSMSFYLLAPLLEEGLKLLPLLAVLFLSARSRALSVVDVLLLGFMVGIGFQFTETVAGRGPGDYTTGLMAIPAGPVSENWQGLFRHGVATGLIAGVIGFWWRARCRERPTGVLASLVWLTVGLVLVLHLAVNVSDGIAPLWEPLAEPLTWLARSPISALLPVMFLTVFAAAVVVDLRDLRTVAPLRSLLLPAFDGSGSSGVSALVRALTAPRLRRLAAIEALGAAPGRSRDGSGGFPSAGALGAIVIGIGATVTMGTGEPERGDASLSCLACLWDAPAGLPVAVGMMLLSLALMVPSRQRIGDRSVREADEP